MSTSSEFRASLEGVAEFEGLADVLDTTAPEVSVRLNRAKGGEALFAEAGRVPWWDGGRYLDGRPSFTRDPALHQGRYYVQDASSMFQAAVLERLTRDMDEPVALLDACAAPGGKTTGAIDALPAGSVVVANEIVPQRAAILVENVAKWGSPAAVVTRSDTRVFGSLPGAFDIVTVDVPCSGEGMMRKDPKAAEQWSAALVAECVARQRMIINNVWEALRPGGYLVYSTCTFNRHENEEMVAYMVDSLGAEPVEVDGIAMPGVTGAIGSDLPCYRFLPGKVRGEGLFLAVVRKPEGETAKCKRDRRTARTISPPAEIKGWIAGGDRYSMLERPDGEVWAIPDYAMPLFSRLDRCADVLQAGIPIAVKAGRGYAPLQQLALSTALSEEAFAAVDVDAETALSYLRRLAVTLPEGTPRGYMLLRHGGCPLGFVKNLGNRANNLYPRHWRILSGH